MVGLEAMNDPGPEFLPPGPHFKEYSMSPDWSKDEPSIFELVKADFDNIRQIGADPNARSLEWEGKSNDLKAKIDDLLNDAKKQRLFETANQILNFELSQIIDMPTGMALIQLLELRNKANILEGPGFWDAMAVSPLERYFRGAIRFYSSLTIDAMEERIKGNPKNPNTVESFSVEQDIKTQIKELEGGRSLVEQLKVPGWEYEIKVKDVGELHGAVKGLINKFEQEVATFGSDDAKEQIAGRISGADRALDRAAEGLGLNANSEQIRELKLLIETRLRLVGAKKAIGEGSLDNFKFFISSLIDVPTFKNRVETLLLRDLNGLPFLATICLEEDNGKIFKINSTTAEFNAEKTKIVERLAAILLKTDFNLGEEFKLGLDEAVKKNPIDFKKIKDKLRLADNIDFTRFEEAKIDKAKQTAKEAVGVAENWMAVTGLTSRYAAPKLKDGTTIEDLVLMELNIQPQSEGNQILRPEEARKRYFDAFEAVRIKYRNELFEYSGTTGELLLKRLFYFPEYLKGPHPDNPSEPQFKFIASGLIDAAELYVRDLPLEENCLTMEEFIKKLNSGASGINGIRATGFLYWGILSRIPGADAQRGRFLTKIAEGSPGFLDQPLGDTTELVGVLNSDQRREIFRRAGFNLTQVLGIDKYLSTENSLTRNSIVGAAQRVLINYIAMAVGFSYLNDRIKSDRGMEDAAGRLYGKLMSWIKSDEANVYPGEIKRAEAKNAYLIIAQRPPLSLKEKE